LAPRPCSSTNVALCPPLPNRHRRPQLALPYGRLAPRLADPHETRVLQYAFIVDVSACYLLVHDSPLSTRSAAASRATTLVSTTTVRLRLRLFRLPLHLLLRINGPAWPTTCFCLCFLLWIPPPSLPSPPARAPEDPTARTSSYRCPARACYPVLCPPLPCPAKCGLLPPSSTKTSSLTRRGARSPPSSRSPSPVTLFDERNLYKPHKVSTRNPISLVHLTSFALLAVVLVSRHPPLYLPPVSPS